MKRFLVTVVCLLFAASLWVGCGQKEETQEGTSAAGQPAEMADTTRMDSAKMHDTTMMQDTTQMEGEQQMETEGH